MPVTKSFRSSVGLSHNRHCIETVSLMSEAEPLRDGTELGEWVDDIYLIPHDLIRADVDVGSCDRCLPAADQVAIPAGSDSRNCDEESEYYNELLHFCNLTATFRQ
jgi:predicted aldo/keto reductase-like oxidoreductase